MKFRVTQKGLMLTLVIAVVAFGLDASGLLDLSAIWENVKGVFDTAETVTEPVV